MPNNFSSDVKITNSLMANGSFGTRKYQHLVLIKQLVDVIKKHENERPEFTGLDYTTREWDAITSAIVLLRKHRM